MHNANPCCCFIPAIPVESYDLVTMMYSRVLINYFYHSIIYCLLSIKYWNVFSTSAWMSKALSFPLQLHWSVCVCFWFYLMQLNAVFTERNLDFLVEKCLLGFRLLFRKGQMFIQKFHKSQYSQNKGGKKGQCQKLSRSIYPSSKGNYIVTVENKGQKSPGKSVRY